MSVLNSDTWQCYVKQAFIILAALYFGWYALHSDAQTFLSGVNLFVHEAGHVIFAPCGERMGMAGGSIAQIAIPALLVWYFWRRDERWQSAVMMFWLGESIIEVARYMADAHMMQLPLIGGEGTLHDWNYLLTSFGVLQHTTPISWAVHSVGMIFMAYATIAGFMFAKEHNVC